MAKGFVLYGVFLWLVLGFCDYAGGGVVGESRVYGVREAGDENQEDEIRDNLRKIFRKEIGIREATGKNDGVRIGQYLAVTGLREGYPWCASFISWVFMEAGYSEPRTPWSPALFPKSRIIYPASRSTSLVSHVPKTGDVFGIYFSNLKRIAHVGFVDEWGEKYVISTEGVRP